MWYTVLKALNIALKALKALNPLKINNRNLSRAIRRSQWFSCMLIASDINILYTHTKWWNISVGK